MLSTYRLVSRAQASSFNGVRLPQIRLFSNELNPTDLVALADAGFQLQNVCIAEFLRPDRVF